MGLLKLEELKGSICVKIINIGHSKVSLFFIGVVGLFMFLQPIIIIPLVVKELTFRVLISCILAWLISIYFMRLYLWNKYGEEVFIISKNTLEVYNNYKIFKDNRRKYDFNKIKIFFFVNGEHICSDELNKDLLVSNGQSSIIEFVIENEVIKSHQEVPISEIFRITKAVAKL